jgi:Domain of unknown function (DUF4168)
MILKRVLPLCFGVATAALLMMPAASTPAIAGGDSNSVSTSQPHPGTKVRVDDATVRKAAAVFPKILKLNKEAESRMQQTNDPQQRQQILSGTRARQMSALREAGISADDYDHVLIALNSDPGLRAKFESYLNSGSGS